MPGLRWLAALAGSLIVAVPFILATSFGALWQAIAAAVTVAFGLLVGVPFGSRERDVAFPMPVATAVAGLLGALPGALVAFVILAAARKVGGP